MSSASSVADTQASRIERMLARDEIHAVLARYARGVDRADGELLKSCYHPDAVEEHGGNYTGNAFEYVDGAVPRIRLMGAMQHLLGSSHIEFDGDVAHVETYLWTFARFASERGSTDTFTGGRLIDRFERRHGRWKIAHRRTVFDWNRDTPSSEGWCTGLFDPSKPGMHLGRKDRSDLSYDRS
jgi:ketosteroid isomerase-like protein